MQHARISVDADAAVLAASPTSVLAVTTRDRVEPLLTLTFGGERVWLEDFHSCLVDVNGVTEQPANAKSKW